MQRSSESKLKIQSPVQCDIASFRKLPKPVKLILITFAPNSLAISAVPSVLNESANMISSTHKILLIQSRIFSISLYAIM